MNLDYIREQWQAKPGNIEYEITAWDSVAESFLFNENKDYDNNKFIKFVKANVELSADMSILDVGCGAGALSVYFAQFAGQVDGVDLSPRMVELGNAYAKEHGIGNMRLSVENWHTCDGSKYERKYDLVFAHTTPAIIDCSTLLKMSNATKNHCFLCKHSRRTSQIFDKLCDMAGFSDRRDNDDSIAYAFDTLWAMGYNPTVSYHHQARDSRRDLEDAKTWYISRLRALGDVSSDTEEEIIKYLTGRAEEGVIKEKMESTLVNMYWRV